jgi:hypothetical protein
MNLSAKRSISYEDEGALEVAFGAHLRNQGLDLAHELRDPGRELEVLVAFFGPAELVAPPGALEVLDLRAHALLLGVQLPILLLLLQNELLLRFKLGGHLRWDAAQ